MKKTLTLVLPIILAGFVQAASTGKAIVPFWIKNTYNDCHIYITNISESTVTVYVTLYDQSGNVYYESSETGEDITPNAGFASDPTESAGATLSAQTTGDIELKSNSETKFGYAVIEWVSSENCQFALIAHLQQNHKNNDLNRYGRTSIPVNEFNPF